jgi:hypothetical protein
MTACSGFKIRAGPPIKTDRAHAMEEDLRGFAGKWVAKLNNLRYLSNMSAISSLMGG